MARKSPPKIGGDLKIRLSRLPCVSGGYASELLELVEVSLDEISLPVGPCAEREAAGSVLLGQDIGPSALPHDGKPAAAMLETLEPNAILLADRAYNSDAIRNLAAEAN